jgi:hypothetical protein
VGERLVGGKIYFLLDCGHLTPARLRDDGDWAVQRVKRCKLCPLPPVVHPNIGICGFDLGKWDEEVGS